MRKRLIFSMLVTILVGFIVMAMITTPHSYKRYIYNGDDVIKTLSFDEADEVSGNFVTYNIDGLPSRNLSVKLGSKMDGYTLLRVCLYNVSDDKYAEKINVPILEGTQDVAVELPEGNYSKMDICIEYGIVIYDHIEFHSKEAEYAIEKVYPSIARTAVAVIIVLFTFVIAYISELKMHIYDKIIGLIKKYYKNIFKLLICVCVSMCAAGIAEIIISAILNIIHKSTFEFNLQRFAYISVAVFLLSILIAMKNNIKDKPEIIVALFILAMGNAMIFTIVPGYTSWDTNSHYEWALSASSFGKAYVTQADLDFCNIYDEVAVKDNRADNIKAMNIFNKDYSKLAGVYRDELSLAHYPAGIAIAVTRFLRMPFYWVFKSGQAANILLYSLLCYFGMRKLKSGKMIYAVIAMLPTNIFLASSYSYDYWVTAFSMLGMAYFIGNCQRKDECISAKDTIIMVGAFTLACIPKQIYILLLLVPFFMPVSKIKNKKKYYAICSCGLLFMAISLFIRTIADTTGAGDLRGGLNVNPSGQVQYILTNFAVYTKRLVKYAAEYVSIKNARNYTVSFSHLGYGRFGNIIIVLLMLITAMTDKNSSDDYKNALLIRLYSVITFAITVLLMITALYINFTPVGLTGFNGCQARYLVPLLYPLMSTIGSSKVINHMKRTWYNLSVIVTMTIITMSGIYVCMLKRML